MSEPPATPLSPPELAARLDRILASAERLVAALPAESLERRGPRGERTLRDLAYHVFRLGLAFADAMDLGGLRASWLAERAPADLEDGAAVARYGALVRGRLSGWFEGAGASEYSRVIDAGDGRRSGRDFLERTTCHAARHLRQLHALAAEVGAEPAPLPAAALEGLPLPASLW